MAGSGWRTFTAGAVLTAAQVQAYLQDQVVQVHASASARSSALGTAASEGMVSYRTDGKVIERYTGSAWVPVGDNIYATSAARGSVVSVAGQVSYLAATDANDTAHQLDFYNGSAWESVKTSQNNVFANGDFSKWTRGTSFTQAWFSAGNVYTADRWRMLWDVTPTAVTVSQQAFTPGAAPVTGYESAYFFRSVITTVGTTTVWAPQQQIEDVRTFAGQTTSISFWAKADSARTLTLQASQIFGSGGSSSVGATLGTSSFNLTTSWQRFSTTITWPSISGKTIGSGSFLQINLLQAAASGSTLDVWGVQLEAGTVASPFRPAGGNTALDTATAGSAGFDGVLVSTNSATNASGSGTTGWAGFDVAGKNKIINGGFDIWQRGTSFISSTMPSAFSADRWALLSDKTASGISITQQAFTPGNAIAGYESPYFLRFTYPTGGTYAIMENRLEDVRTFAGQTVTLSFWAKCSTGTVANAPGISQVFGTGGSAAVDTILSASTITTSWQRFSFTFTMPSIAGKTIGANSTIYIRAFRTLDNPGATVDIWGVQLEAGSVATPFSRAGGTLQGELAACQRYYWRIGGNTLYEQIGLGFASTTGQGRFVVKNPVSMRVPPTSLDYSTLAAWDGTTVTALSSLAINTGQVGKEVVWIEGGATGIVQYRPYGLFVNNSLSGYFGLSAEL